MEIVYKVLYREVAYKEFKKLGSKNKINENLLETALDNLKNLDIDKGLRDSTIDIMEASKGKPAEQFKKKGYNPAIYEYKKFPKKHPLRLYFMVNEGKKELIIIMAMHHKEMKSDFENILLKRAKYF